MTSIGELLSSKRKQRGNSIQDVERAIKIRAKYLEALEADDFDSLPGEAYVAGFIKSYGEYLGIDPAEMIESYWSEHESPKLSVPKPVMAASKERPRIPLVLLLAVVAVAGLAAAGWLGFSLIKALQPGAKAPAEKTAAVVEASKAPRKPEAGKKTAAASRRPRPFLLKIVAVDDKNWLAVNVDGQKVFDGSIGAGGRRVWRVRRRIVIRSTTADVLRLYRDGKFLGKLGAGFKLVQRTYVPLRK